MLNVAIGAAIGAVLGAGAVALRGMVGDEPITWKSIVAGVVGGAAVGSVASLTFGASLLAGSTAAKIGGLTAAGALGGASEQTTDNLLHGRRWSKDVAKNTAIGAAVGGATGVAGKVAAKPAAALARTRIGRGAISAAKRLGGRLASVGRSVWGRYMSALKSRPILTKTLTSGTIGGAGDVIAQKLQGNEELDLKRLAFMTTWSMLWAAPGHHWFNYLERWFPGTSGRAMLGKLALERFLWTPPTTVVTLGAKALYEGEGVSGAVRSIREDFWITYGTNWLFWPAANAISFRYVPLDLRIPFGNAVGLGWGVMFSALMYGEEDVETEDAQEAAPEPIGESAEVPDSPIQAAAKRWRSQEPGPPQAGSAQGIAGSLVRD